MFFKCSICGKEFDKINECEMHESICGKDKEALIKVMEVAYTYRTNYEESGKYMIGKNIIVLTEDEYSKIKTIKNESDFCDYMNDGFLELKLGKFATLLNEDMLQCGDFEKDNIYYLTLDEEMCSTHYDLDVRMKVRYNEENEFAISVLDMNKYKYEIIKDLECDDFEIRRNVRYA